MGRPFVHLNCAISLDGKLAGPGGAKVSLSDEVDWRRVHGLRAKYDGILVGVRTILRDNPSLRVKTQYFEGEHDNPVRIVLDTAGRTPNDAAVRDGSVKTLLVHGPSGQPGSGVEGIEAQLLGGQIDIEDALLKLHSQGITELLVEGGAAVFASFLAAGCWDKFTVYQAPRSLGDGPGLPPFSLPLVSRESAGKGVLWTFARNA